MSWTRAAVVIAVVSLTSAGLLALVSRTPADVRRAEPGREATEPRLGARFTDQQVARNAAYAGPRYLATGLFTLLGLVVLVILASGPFGRLVGVTQRAVPGGWAVHAFLLAGATVVVTAVASLPLAFVSGYSIAHAWGLSTQDLGGWLGDQGRALLVSAIVSGVAAVAFFAVVRWQPRTWWVWGWLAFSALTALLVFVYPVVIAPMFNTFTPVEDRDLSTSIRRLASDAGVAVDEVLVADASRRTTAENAYVAGLGATKRMVLYDTLIRSGSPRETEFVAAHELGHAAENHVLKGVTLSSVGLLAGFGMLAFVAARAAPWRWAGAEGIADLRTIPLLLLFLAVASLVALPVENAVSRRFEARADRIAIELTGDPDTAVRSFRRLAFSNLADLRPPRPAVWLLYTHPPIPDRIRAALTSRR
jgi:STE24 endopeptidase